MMDGEASSELKQRAAALSEALYRVTECLSTEEVLRTQLRKKAIEIFEQIFEHGFPHGKSSFSFTPVIAKIETMKGFLSLAQSLGGIKPENFLVLSREYDHLVKMLEKAMQRQYIPVERSDPEIPVGEGASRFELKIEGEQESWDTTGESLEKGQERNRGYFRNGKKGESKDAYSAAEGGQLSTQNREVNPVRSLHGALSPAFAKKTDWHASHGVNERQKTILAHLKESHQAKVSDFYPFFQEVSSKTIQRDLQNLVAKDILRKAGEKRWTTYVLNDVR